MKKLTIKNFIEGAQKVHGEKYNYDRSIYVNNRTKIEIECTEHGVFSQLPGSHLSGHGCKGCGIIAVSEKQHRSTTSAFILAAKIIHGSRFDYSQTHYISRKRKVNIICTIHDEIFSQTPDGHLKGSIGCLKCNGRLKTTDEFIAQAQVIHGLKFDYTPTMYDGSEHGIFKQLATDHLRGCGCAKCIGWHKTTDEFIKEAHAIHAKRYDYTKSQYNGAVKKLTIICPDHGEFSQTARDHLRGTGCPQCSYIISKGETEFLDLIGIHPDNRQLKIGRYKVDGFDPETNTVWEFDGDFWHGNPTIYDRNAINPRTNTTFGELYDKTLRKKEILEKSGYNVISIWESDLEQFKKEYNNY